MTIINDKEFLSCDESKCVSRVVNVTQTGVDNNEDDDENYKFSYNCWAAGRGTLRPFSCADGYEGVPVSKESQPPIWTNNEENYYYTCCPPNLPNITVATNIIMRHCGDPIPVQQQTTEDSQGACQDNETFPFPRNMTFANGNEDIWGRLEPMDCDSTDSVFQYPGIVRTIGKGTLFECCRTESSTHYFVATSTGFKATIYVQLTISAIGLIVTLIIVLSLILPPIVHIFNKNKSSEEGSNGRKRRGRNAINRDGGVARGTTVASRQRQQQLRFNAYDLYVVFLAIPDMIFCSWVLVLYTRYAKGHITPVLGLLGLVSPTNWAHMIFWGSAVIGFCTTTNLYLNALIANEIFTLLKNSNERRRCNPPTLRKATFKIVIVYSIAFLYFIIIGSMGHRFRNNKWSTFFLVFFYTMEIILPTSYLVYVCITIWRQGLMKSLGGQLKALVLFFCGICSVVYLLWVPGHLIYDLSFSIYFRRRSESQLLYSIGILFCSIQVVVSAGIKLTKPDIRRKVTRLLTLSCCQQDDSQQRRTRNRGPSTTASEAPVSR
ncbi:hypothetical protein FRACYDRAFT_254471 [Fragilariopsis cylindrus CCMP1102]|uniref:Uncharacterized protein n=1 Tax=Fragilariopsis cylindrus CCMP1102 TaxID=635003 RepID=A0A1E7EKP0_9STRA|nr:hypothetical protein FRACYDRAFT_254471 [Fragilariopsis cylindrus CCMP1102]|eukprot:OEU06454.1 hypothetical protein FRACYDRAFT_254471 [Fragilariopsis cylindrus CCMP1102]